MEMTKEGEIMSVLTRESKHQLDFIMSKTLRLMPDICVLDTRFINLFDLYLWDRYHHLHSGCYLLFYGPQVDTCADMLSSIRIYLFLPQLPRHLCPPKSLKHSRNN